MTGAETCNEIRCGFSLPYCIRVPEEEISFPYKDIQCVLIFSRVARRDSSEELIPGMMDGYLDVVTQDRFGRYDFSKVTLVFRRNYFDYDPTFDDKKVLDLALKVLNRFLQFYRRAYDEYWVIGVTQMDILHWMVLMSQGL